MVSSPFSFEADEMEGKVLPGSEFLIHFSKFRC